MHQLQEISQGLREVFDEVNQYTNGLSQEALTDKPLPEKWSAGQNLLHLILSTKPLAKVMPLPKITFKTFGKPNRPGRSYEELVQRYKERLAESNPTPGRGYQPTEEAASSKEKLLADWQKEGDKLIKSLNKWKDEDLDKYLLPHPLLGKLSVREMMFFTHYHSLHHLAIMKERVEG